MGESFGSRIIAVEKVITPDPELSGSVLEEDSDIAAAQAIRIMGIVAKRAEPVAIVASQAILGPKPHKALIVLRDGRDSGRRRFVSGGQAHEAETRVQALRQMQDAKKG